MVDVKFSLHAVPVLAIHGSRGRYHKERRDQWMTAS